MPMGYRKTKGRDMKLLRVMLVLFAIGFSTNSNGGIVTELGMTSCGNWVKDKVENPASRIQAESWLAGYISGANVWKADGNLDILAKTNAESIHLWMDNYCKDNPSKYVNDGAYDLIFELYQKHVGK
jgi:hypothetical protein